MRPLLAAPLALLALPLLGAVALPPDSIRPGYWEVTSHVTAPVTQTKVENRCITAHDVERFMMGSPNHIYTCTYPLERVSGGRLKFQGDCVSRHGRKLKISGEGTYSPTSLHLQGQVTGNLGPLPITGEASTDARRLADVCPPGAAGSPQPAP